MKRHNYIDTIKVLNDNEIWISYIHKDKEYTGILTIAEKRCDDD